MADLQGVATTTHQAGTYDLTDAVGLSGRTPKAAVIFTQYSETDGVRNPGAGISIGAHDGTSGFQFQVLDKNNVGTTDSGRQGSTTEILSLDHPTFPGPVFATAEFGSFIPNGVRLINANAPNLPQVSAWLIDCAQAEVGTFDIDGGTNPEVFNLGWRPTFVMVFGCFEFAFLQKSTFDYHVGFAVDDGVPTNVGGHRFSLDGQATANYPGYASSSAVMLEVGYTSLAAVFNATGFQLEATPTQTVEGGWLAVRLNESIASAHLLEVTNGTGPKSWAPGFTPQFVAGCPTTIGAADATDVSEGIGICVGRSGVARSAGVDGLENAGTTVTGSISANDWRLHAGGGGLVYTGIPHLANNEAGVDLSVNNNGVSAYWPMLAIGEPATGGSGRQNIAYRSERARRLRRRVA